MFHVGCHGMPTDLPWGMKFPNGITKPEYPMMTMINETTSRSNQKIEIAF